MRAMGLDVGERRIGVALSDELGVIASPHTVLAVQGRAIDAKAIDALARANDVRVIVVGLPRNLDGSLGHQAEQVKRFVKELRRHTESPIEYIDERLTTVAASRAMRESGVKSRQQRGALDAIAATIALQGYLDQTQRRTAEVDRQTDRIDGVAPTQAKDLGRCGC